eukprot:CAMPEP_0119330160 /NCGR_PEP_ID=MMETSP1333-20130426/77659_1 /TAXON_ID=418940 /ORGANISM="Scyphosphaera apsteinii, Strain RCC1455" /LENGTH=248 /DNA_ID=CAMNT_0007339483 /DNA_START=130 /DNA_END=876 /DNA_ORIENTATION=+
MCRSVVSEKDASHFRLLETSLTLARKQLTEQASLLSDAQSRVALLMCAQQQQQPHCTVGIEVHQNAHSAPGSKLEPPGPKTAGDTSAALNQGDVAMPPAAATISQLRGLLKSAVRTRIAQQLEIDELRNNLANARSTAAAMEIKHEHGKAALQDAQIQVESLAEQLRNLQDVHVSHVRSAEERTAELETKIHELEQAEVRRIAIQEALEAAAPEPAINAPTTPIGIIPVSPVQPAGVDFSSAAGGFAL